jgi:alpha-1,3-mannosyltransferase
MIPKRRCSTAVATIVLLVVSIFLLHSSLYRHRRVGQASGSYNTWCCFGKLPSRTNVHVSLGQTLFPPFQTDLRAGNATRLAEASKYIQAILNPENDAFDRLKCSAPNAVRYNYLKNPSTDGDGSRKQYYFALLLHQSVQLLPRLMGSIVETIRFLGPENCALSILEGRSDDGTYEVLRLLQQPLNNEGIQYFFQSNDVEITDEGRIATLTALRNQALNPLRLRRDQFSDSSSIIYLNDVAACPDDILELIHQRAFQSADMTCAMDWTHPSADNPLFYDVWIARGMTGNTFFPIRDNGSWDLAQNLFWNDENTRSRLDGFKPFQVFSCWNGATAFTAAPILSDTIKFRTSSPEECFQGEPQLFCKDLWLHGYRRIAVVPTVNLQYTDENAKLIKQQKGYVADLVEKHEDAEARIDWQQHPPSEVKCMPSFTNQFFRPWNEGFTSPNPVP